MGDRACVRVVDGGKGVELYTHWDGHKLPAVVQEALRDVPGRWQDSPYLARAIFSRMVKGDVLGDTGFGIWLIGTMENEYDEFVVDCLSCTVRIGDRSWSFKDFVDIKNVSWVS